MKIYVLSKQGYEGSETVCVSEDINKIRTSICKDFDAKEDYPELEIWEDGETIYGTSGNDVLNKVAEEISNLQDKQNLTDEEYNKHELATDIVELFENLLDKKEIEIPCKDSIEQSDRYDGGNDAKLYGMEYYNLVDAVQELL